MSPSITNSTTVDERIVEMRIDNSKFEDGAKKTIGILEKLDKALHLHAETDEIDKLTDAVGKFDVSPMANGLDSLQSHFSALEIAGMRVISNLTDSVYNFTAKTLKDFTIEPVSQGWDKFGDKTTAVATLKAQGYELETVNRLMEQLNWFTDETSYNFTDMVGNIAKFTATGQDLDESVTAMEGIALWAALSGQNATKASMAMYQLSQAMGKGALKYDDYKSIQNASMDTQEFRQQAVAAAEAVGKLKKVGEDTWTIVGDGAKETAKIEALQTKIYNTELDLTYAKQKQAAATTESSMASAQHSIDKLEYKLQGLYEDLEALSGGGGKGAYTLSELFSSDALSRNLWFTSDVMMDVFNKYAKGVAEVRRYMDDNDLDTASTAMQQLREEATSLAEEIGVTLDEAFQLLGYDIDEFSLKAFEAGQQARTWKDVVDSVKDAVSTGWMNTFEIIFGDADKAIGFWTNMSNKFWDLFASGGETRNNILKVAMGTADNIKEAADYIGNVYGSFSPKTKDIVDGIGDIVTESKELAPPIDEATQSWDTLQEKIKDLNASSQEFDRALSGVIGFTAFGQSMDYDVGALIRQYGSLEKAFDAGAVSAYDLSSALDLLSNSEYKNLWREYQQIDPLSSDPRRGEILHRMNEIELETLVMEGRTEEIRRRYEQALAEGQDRDYKIDEALDTLEKAERQINGFANMSAWDKLDYEINQNGKTIEDFQESLDQVLHESKAVGLDELIEKYGSLEEALKSGEIEADEFYEALVNLRNSDSISETAEEIEQATHSATHSLEELKEVATGVLRGDYGNGEDRRKALEALGYNYDLVQGIAEIMNNGGQGYIGITEEFLRNEYPTFYAMMQDQIALNEEYADTWDNIVNSEEDAANLLNEIQNSSYSPKTDGVVTATETAMDRALAPYQTMLDDLEAELVDAYQEYENLEKEIALHGIAGHEGDLEKISKRIEEITSQIDTVAKKMQLIQKIDLLNSVDVSGWDLFTGSINRILEILVKIKETASEASENVFGDTVTRGLNLQLALSQFHNFVQQITMSEEAIDGVRKVFEGFFTVVRIGERVLGIAAKIFGNLTVLAVKFLDKVFAIFGQINASGFISIIDTILDTLSDGVDILFNPLFNLLDSEKFSSFLSALGSGFSYLLTPLMGLVSIGQSVIDFFIGIFNKLSEFISFDQIVGGLSSTLQVFAMTIAGILGAPLYAAFTIITNIFTAIRDGVVSLYEMARSSETLQGIISSVYNHLQNFYSVITRLGNYISEGFKNGGFIEGLQAFWSGLKIEIRTSLPTLYNILSNIFGLFSSSWTLISNAFSSLLNGFNTEALQGFFDGTLSFFQALPQFLGNGIKGIGEIFAVIFGGILQLVSGVLKSLKGAKLDTDKIEESFNHFYETAQAVFSGIFGDPTELKERIKNFILEAWTGFKEAVSQISLLDAFKAFRAATLLALIAKISSVLGTIKRVSYEAASIPEAITKAIGKGSMVFDDIGKSFRANAMVKLASSLVMVAMALWGLSRIPADKLTHAASIAALVMVVLGMVVNSINSNKSFQNVDIKHFQVFDTIGSALIGLGVSIAAFTFAILKLEQIASSDSFLPAVLTVIGFIVLLGIIAGVFAAAFTKSDMNMERLKAVGTIMTKLGQTMLLMSLSIGNLVMPVLAFTAAAALLQRNDLDPNFVWYSGALVGALLMMLGLLVAHFINVLGSIKEEQLKYVGGAMLKIAGSMYILAMALGRFMLPFFALAIVCSVVYSQTRDLAPIWNAFGMVAGLLLELSVIIATLTWLVSRKGLSSTKIKALGTAMLKIGGSVALIGLGIKMLVNSMLAIAVVTAVLEHFNHGSAITSSLITLTEIAGGLLAVMFVLSKISSMKGVDSTKLLGIAAVIAAIGVAILLLTPAIVGLGVVIGIFVYFISTLTDATEVLNNMKSTTWILIGIAVAAAVFGGALLLAGSGALKVALAFGVLAVGVLALAAAFTLLGEHQDNIIKFFKRFINFFEFSPDKLKTLGLVAAGVVVFTIALVALLALTGRILSFLKVFSGFESLGPRVKTSLGSLKTSLLGGLKNTFVSVQNFLTDPKNIDTITLAIGGIITTAGLYLAGVIPTFTETVVTSLITLVSSLSESIMAHREEFSQALSDGINTIFAIAGDVFRSVFLDPESWAEGGFGGGIVRVLFGLFLTAKVFQAIGTIGKMIGSVFGLHIGKGAPAAIAEEIAKGAGDQAIKKAAESLGAEAGTAAKSGFMAKFGTIWSKLATAGKSVYGALEGTVGGELLIATAALAVPLQVTYEIVKKIEDITEKGILENAFKFDAKGNVSELGDTVTDYGTAVERIMASMTKLEDERKKYTKETEADLERIREHYESLYPKADKAFIDAKVQAEIEDNRLAAATMEEVQGLDTRLQHYQNVLNELYAAIADTMGITTDELYKQIEAYGSITTVVGEYAKQVSEVQETQANMQTTAEAVQDTMQDTSAVDSMKDAYSQFMDMVKAVPDKVKESTEEAGVSVDALKNTLKENGIEDLAASVGIELDLDSLTDTEISDMFNELSNKLGTSMDGSAIKSTISEKFGSYFKLDEETINSTFSDLGGWVASALGLSLDDNKGLAEEGMEKLTDGMENTYRTKTGTFSPSKVYENLAKWIPEGISQGVAQKTYLAVNAIAAMARNMQAPFERVYDRFMRFGMQAVNGVVVGITTHMQAAYNAGADLANAVNRGYSDTLQIHSPSRVFIALSRFIPEGVANGIEQGIPTAVAAVNELSKVLADEAAYAMSHMAYIASDEYNFSPTITPVVDLSGAYSGMNQLNRILADSPMSMDVKTNPGRRMLSRLATDTNSNNQNRIPSNVDININIDNMAVRSDQDIRAISKQLANEVRVALRQKGVR